MLGIDILHHEEEGECHAEEEVAVAVQHCMKPGKTPEPAGSIEVAANTVAAENNVVVESIAEVLLRDIVEVTADDAAVPVVAWAHEGAKLLADVAREDPC